MQSGRRIALIGMIVSGGLAALKITVGELGNSTALTADGFESAADVVASGTIFLALTLAMKPPDSNHPYGHGRIETLAGLLLGFVLFCAGIAISAHALLLEHDQLPMPSVYAIWPLILSVV